MTMTVMIAFTRYLVTNFIMSIAVHSSHFTHFFAQIMFHTVICTDYVSETLQSFLNSLCFRHFPLVLCTAYVLHSHLHSLCFTHFTKFLVQLMFQTLYISSFAQLLFHTVLFFARLMFHAVLCTAYVSQLFSQLMFRTVICTAYVSHRSFAQLMFHTVRLHSLCFTPFFAQLMFHTPLAVIYTSYIPQTSNSSLHSFCFTLFLQFFAQLLFHILYAV